MPNLEAWKGNSHDSCTTFQGSRVNRRCNQKNHEACCSTLVCWQVPYSDCPALSPKPLEAAGKGQSRQRPLLSSRSLSQYSLQSMPASNCRCLGMFCPLCQPGPRGWYLVSAGNKPTFPWRALGSSCLALTTVWPERSLPQKLFLWEIAKEHRQMFTSVSQELPLHFHTLAKPTSTQGASSGLFAQAVTVWVRVCILCLVSGWIACCPPTQT